MLQRIVDPDKEGMRMYLISPVTGKVLAKRANISTPCILNTTGQVFFPREEQANDWGGVLRDSVKSFVAEHGIFQYNGS
jgi:hypothetical protein